MQAPTTDRPTGGIAAYRAVFGLPGVAPLTGVAFLARIPATAAGITLTLHVVITLGHGYAAAGLLGAAATVGMAIGAPLLGRLIDRRGLRTRLALTLCAEAVFWAAAPVLPYPVLLVGAVLGGLLGIPVFAMTRQSLAVLVPDARRRSAFRAGLHVGRAVLHHRPRGRHRAGAAAVHQHSDGVVGAGWVLSGMALWALNPPTRSPKSTADGPAPPVRERLDLRLLAALLATRSPGDHPSEGRGTHRDRAGPGHVRPSASAGTSHGHRCQLPQAPGGGPPRFQRPGDRAGPATGPAPGRGRGERRPRRDRRTAADPRGGARHRTEATVPRERRAGGDLRQLLRCRDGARVGHHAAPSHPWRRRGIIEDPAGPIRRTVVHTVDDLTARMPTPCRGGSVTSPLGDPCGAGSAHAVRR